MRWIGISWYEHMEKKMIDITDFFNRMFSTDATIRGINANVIYNNKLNNIFNSYTTDKGFAEAVVAEGLASVHETRKIFFNPFISHKNYLSGTAGFSDKQDLIPRIELYKNLKKEIRTEEARIAITNYIISCITKQNLDFNSFIDYITVGILVDNFFQTNRRQDTLFVRLKQHIRDNWKTFNETEIALYINARNLLFHVIRTNNSTVLQHILTFDSIDVCTTDDNGNPLLKYCKDIELIKILLNKCISDEKKSQFVNMHDKYNKSVLFHFAYQVDDTESETNQQIISLLIHNGANANIDENGVINDTKQQLTQNAFIQKIILAENYSLAKFILEKTKINVNIKERINGKTLLHTAVDKNAKDIVKILVKQISKNNIDAQDDDAKTALLYAMQNNADAAIVKYLLDNGANPNFEDINGRTPLFFVKNAESFQHLIDNPNTDFWHKDIVDKNFMYYIIDDDEIIEKLINFLDKNPDKKRDCFLLNRYNENPFHWVTSAGLCKMYIKLLDNDYKQFIQQKNIRGDTPLHWARNAEIAELLIKNGADVNARNDALATPLHWAETVDIAKTLIKHHAIINALDDIGNTPIMYAEKHDNEPVKNFLENCTDTPSEIVTNTSTNDTLTNKAKTLFHRWFK